MTNFVIIISEEHGVQTYTSNMMEKDDFAVLGGGVVYSANNVIAEYTSLFIHPRVT